MVEFAEKPDLENHWINGGYFFFQRHFLKYLSEDESCVLERDPLVKLARDDELNIHNQKFAGGEELNNLMKKVQRQSDEINQRKKNRGRGYDVLIVPPARQQQSMTAERFAGGNGVPLTPATGCQGYRLPAAFFSLFCSVPDSSG